MFYKLEEQRAFIAWKEKSSSESKHSFINQESVLTKHFIPHLEDKNFSE